MGHLPRHRLRSPAAWTGAIAAKTTRRDGMRPMPHGRTGSTGSTVETPETDARQGVDSPAIDDLLETTFLLAPILTNHTVRHFGPLRFVRLLASPRRSERSAARIMRDRNDGIRLRLSIRGRAGGDANGRTIVSTPGSIMLLDFAQSFSIADEEERDIVDVVFPRALLARHIDGLELLHGTLIDSPAGTILGANLLALADQIDALTDARAAMIGDTLLNLTLLALGWDPGRTDERPVGGRCAMLTRAEQLINSRLASDELTPEWLGAELNMSRSDLYNLFKDHRGVVRYIWRRRLEAARGALADVDDTRRIGEIGFAFGFSSESHFARAFRRAFGTTASEVRAESVRRHGASNVGSDRFVAFTNGRAMGPRHD